MNHPFACILVAAALVGGTPARAGDVGGAEASWEGLVLVPSKRLDMVYLRPGADFSGYTKVILDPTEVAFTKDWLRDYNNAALFASARVSESQLQHTISESVKAASDLFTQAWTKGGYAVVQTPGPDVMQVRTGVLNISVAAPETPGAGRTHSFDRAAGKATFYVEIRDSMSGTLMGRAVDQKLIGDDLNTSRTGATNRADFRREVERWADISVQGMVEIKAASPLRIGPKGPHVRGVSHVQD